MDVFTSRAKIRAINSRSFQGISYANQAPPLFIGHKKAIFSLVNNLDVRELDILIFPLNVMYK